MAGKCCGDPQLPKTLIGTQLVRPELIDATIGVDALGREVKAGDCLTTCDDLAALNEAIRAYSDAEDDKLKAELLAATIGVDAQGREVKIGACLTTCDDLAKGAAVSKGEGNVVRPGNDGGAYVGISTDPKNVTKVDSKGNIITPISSSANNATRKGPDGGIYTGISTDPKNVTKLDGSGNIITPISSDQNNIVKKGADGGIYAGIAAGGGVAVDQNGNIKLAIKGCDGNVHADGTTIPSCAQMNAAIGAAKQAAVNEAASRIPPAQDVMSIVRAGLGSLISGDAGNIIRLGSDGKLYAAATGGSGTNTGVGRGSFYTTSTRRGDWGGSEGNGGSCETTLTITLLNLAASTPYLLKVGHLLYSFESTAAGKASMSSSESNSSYSGTPPCLSVESISLLRSTILTPEQKAIKLANANPSRAKDFTSYGTIALFDNNGEFLASVYPA